MQYSFRDLYPTYSGGETSTEVIPDNGTQEALNENTSTAEQADGKHSRGKQILLAVIVIGLLVFLLGGVN